MKYPLPMRILHWLMSIIILCLLAIGIYMTGLAPDAPHKYDWYFWHKSFGMMILGLIFLRVYVRLRSNVPPPAPGISALETKAALLTHKVLLALMFIVPLCGYLMAATYSKSGGVPFFGLFIFPDILPKNDTVSGFFRESHDILAFSLLGVIVLHVLAVIKHWLWDKQNLLKRMW